MSESNTKRLLEGKRKQSVTALRLESGVTIPLRPADKTWIGSAADCDIVLSDPHVSQRHCFVDTARGTSVLTDNRSKNGTRVEGCEIQAAPISPGQRIWVGSAVLTAQGDDDRSKAAATEIIGHDARLLSALEQAKHAARSDFSVLLVGETGTGKELFAQLIHRESRRCHTPLVSVNCGEIPLGLVTSELFGAVRGAYTGSDVHRTGLFRHAHRGTLFLDEIGELPLEAQCSLLRALESHMIRPVGAELEVMVDVRVVAATNRKTISRGSHFRRDLFHRLATLVIEVPPLRERMGDLEELCCFFLGSLEPKFGPRTLTAAALQRLRRHTWPGNIRELRNTIRRGVALSTRQITPEQLFPESRFGLVTEPSSSVQESLTSYQTSQRQLIQEALDQYGTIRAAAESLGIPKSTFADQARRFGVARRRVGYTGRPRDDA